MGFDTESSEVVTFTIMHGDGCKLYNHLRAWIQATSLVSKFESKARMAHLVRTPVFCEISSKNCSNQQSASPETTKTVLQLDHVLRGREVSPHDTAQPWPRELPRVQGLMPRPRGDGSKLADTRSLRGWVFPELLSQNVMSTRCLTGHRGTSPLS